MSEETLNKLLESIDNALWDLKHNRCNVDTEEKGWKTYYGLDYNLIKYIRRLEIRVEQLEKENISLKKANNYHQEMIKSMKEPENVHHYHLENIKLRAINNQLENIRKEAIEYVKNDSYFDGSGICANDLLKILNKGSEDNE